METRTYTVYKFKELPEEAQQKALEKHGDINVNYDWWQFIYEDAWAIGLKIEGFDLDRGSYCKGRWIESPYQAIKLIKENHGPDTETYKTAVEYEKRFAELGKDEDGYQIEDEDLEQDFLNSLLEDYRISLQHEYGYLISKEAIIETFEANDYCFTIDGDID